MHDVHVPCSQALVFQEQHAVVGQEVLRLRDLVRLNLHHSPDHADYCRSSEKEWGVSMHNGTAHAAEAGLHLAMPRCIPMADM